MRNVYITRIDGRADRRMEDDEKRIGGTGLADKVDRSWTITVVPVEAFRKMLTNSFPNLKEHLNLVPRAMPVRGLGWHWLWGNWQPETLNLGVPVLCRHARLINVKPITAQEKVNFPRANAILARAQAWWWWWWWFYWSIFSLKIQWIYKYVY
jgi:hypothetical protein